jgi:hypothetical protein
LRSGLGVGSEVVAWACCRPRPGALVPSRRGKSAAISGAGGAKTGGVGDSDDDDCCGGRDAGSLIVVGGGSGGTSACSAAPEEGIGSRAAGSEDEGGRWVVVLPVGLSAQETDMQDGELPVSESIPGERERSGVAVCRRRTGPGPCSWEEEGGGVPASAAG